MGEYGKKHFLHHLADGEVELTREQLIQMIRGYDMKFRIINAYLSAFIMHHRSPKFSDVPDIDEAEAEVRKANDYNVLIQKAVETQDRSRNDEGA